MSMYIGEALVGDGNEIAHIDLLIGSKDGPVGNAFANALARQSEGHSNLLAVITPNLLCKPATVLITKVTIKGAKQAVQMFGPAQAAVARAVAGGTHSGTGLRHRSLRAGATHPAAGLRDRSRRAGATHPAAGLRDRSLGAIRPRTPGAPRSLAPRRPPSHARCSSDRALGTAR